MKVDPKFAATFEGYFDPNFDDLSHHEWVEVMDRYIVHGLHPGGFFTSLLANNMMNAMGSCHQLNPVKAIKSLCVWVQNSCPSEAWGSYDKVAAWCKLTQEERRIILEKHNLVTTVWDILNE
jgi:hypothetical protein